jgi:hypothetical protein
MNTLFRTLFLLVLPWLTVPLSAQNPGEETGVNEYRPANQRSISGESWKKAAGDMDYSGDRPRGSNKKVMNLHHSSPLYCLIFRGWAP